MTAFEFFKKQLDKSIADGRMQYPMSLLDICFSKDASWGGAWGSEVGIISDLQDMLEQGIMIHYTLTKGQAQGLSETEVYMLSNKGRIIFYEHFFGRI